MTLAKAKAIIVTSREFTRKAYIRAKSLPSSIFESGDAQSAAYRLIANNRKYLSKVSDALKSARDPLTEKQERMVVLLTKQSLGNYQLIDKLAKGNLSFAQEFIQALRELLSQVVQTVVQPIPGWVKAGIAIGVGFGALSLFPKRAER